MERHVRVPVPLGVVDLSPSKPTSGITRLTASEKVAVVANEHRRVVGQGSEHRSEFVDGHGSLHSPMIAPVNQPMHAPRLPPTAQPNGTSTSVCIATKVIRSGSESGFDGCRKGFIVFLISSETVKKRPIVSAPGNGGRPLLRRLE